MKQKVLFSLLILMLMSISVSAQTGGGRIAGVVIDNTDAVSYTHLTLPTNSRV